jgi:serine/threonine protein kinase
VDIEKDELGNTILNGEYLISTTIEQGSYGKIKLARHITTGELYVSQIQKNQSNISNKLI